MTASDIVGWAILGVCASVCYVLVALPFCDWLLRRWG